ncbi:uncharacterized protein LOC134069122 [Sardina pilchardus]|uniref:uncharacterized protein LOC134069122 n=1 Tax=Sardina pilchardus TaxID=27697 RepID=UPI002E12D6C6
MELQLLLTLPWIAGLFCQTELYTFKHVKVFASSTSPNEGENVTLKCAVCGGNSSANYHMYLCKNGVAVQMQKLTGDNDAIFALTTITSRESGNYSCVYANKKIPYSEVNSTGKYSIIIQVKSENKSLPGTLTTTLAPDGQKYEVIQLILILIAILLALLGMCYIAYRKIYKTILFTFPTVNTASADNTLDDNVLYYDHTGQPVQDIYDS